MSDEDETKSFMKKLVSVISGMSESLRSLEEKIIMSSRQMALLTKQVEAIASKINQIDLEVEEEFGKLGKDPSHAQAVGGLQAELKKMEQDLSSIPDELLDDELQKLLEEEGESKQKKEKEWLFHIFNVISIIYQMS